MNCCDEYGNCNQGRDCPVRAARDSGVCSQEPQIETDGEYVFWLTIVTSITFGVLYGAVRYLVGAL